MNNSRPDSLWREGLLATSLYTALTLALTYPLSVRPADTALAMGADTDLLLWLIAWDVHAFIRQPWAIFDANIYYPYQHTLAYSENIIGNALLAMPIVLTTGNIVLALNVVSLLSCVLCGTGTYVLVRRLGFSRPSAVVAGLIFAFAPPRFFRLSQPHLAAIQWTPFALAFLHHYLDTGRRRQLWWACGCFAMQALSSGHGTVFAAISIAALLAWRFVLGEPLRPFRRLRDLGVPGLLFLVLAFLPLLPYRAAQREVGLRRTLNDAYEWAPNLATLLASPTHLHSWILSRWPTDWSVLDEAKAFLFPGYLALLLGAAGVWTLRATAPRQPAGPRSAWRIAAGIVELAFLISLAVAIAATALGGFRLRFQGEVVLTVREIGRAWAYPIALAVLRLVLRRRAPFDVRRRVRRARERFRRWAPVRRNDPVAFYTLLAVLTLWLALGPEFGLYRLVYDLPAFNFIRVPTRYSMASLLALSVLAAAGFDRLTRNRPKLRVAAALVCGSVLVAEYAAVPLGPVPYRVDIPAIDRWLDTQPKPFVVAELPLGNPFNVAGFERRQSAFMLHTLGHWQKTVHGYSGIRPVLHAGLFDEMVRFPNDDAFVGLTDIGATYLVVHTDYYAPEEWARVESLLHTKYKPWATLERTEGPGRVYRLRPLSDEVLLRRRFDDYLETALRGDHDSRAAFYTPDALVVRPGGWIARGAAAIADWLAHAREHPEQAAPNVWSVVVEGADGRIEGSYGAAGGEDGKGGHFLQMWRKIDGRWRLTHDLVSPDATAPPGRAVR